MTYGDAPYQLDTNRRSRFTIGMQRLVRGVQKGGGGETEEGGRILIKRKYLCEILSKMFKKGEGATVLRL